MEKLLSKDENGPTGGEWDYHSNGGKYGGGMGRLTFFTNCV